MHGATALAEEQLMSAPVFYRVHAPSDSLVLVEHQEIRRPGSCLATVSGLREDVADTLISQLEHRLFPPGTKEGSDFDVFVTLWPEPQSPPWVVLRFPEASLEAVRFVAAGCGWVLRPGILFWEPWRNEVFFGRPFNNRAFRLPDGVQKFPLDDILVFEEDGTRRSGHALD